MILHDASLYGAAERVHIYIEKDRIKNIVTRRMELDSIKDAVRIELDGALVLPGLINSHDHLDFNLFPSLKTGNYTNYTQWGRDIQLAHREIIQEVLKVPASLRVSWGIYKNLLNGFTTVVNHGKRIADMPKLIHIFQYPRSLHSTAFEKRWIYKLNNPLSSKTIVLHLGEGTDKMAYDEISKVAGKNYLHKKIVAVHGVAMDKSQTASFSGLVWCPASNFFLFNKTATVDMLKAHLPVVFGTDSTLTASWNSALHYQAAMQTGMISEQELVAMLTTTAATVWNIKDRTQLLPGYKADLTIVPQQQTVFTDFSVVATISEGNFRLAHRGIADQAALFKQGFDKIYMNDKECLVSAGIISLAEQVKTFYPAAAIPFNY